MIMIALRDRIFQTSTWTKAKGDKTLKKKNALDHFFILDFITDIKQFIQLDHNGLDGTS